MQLTVPLRYFPVISGLIFAFGVLLPPLISLRTESSAPGTPRWTNFLSQHCQELHAWSSLITSASIWMPARFVWRFSLCLWLITRMVTAMTSLGQLASASGGVLGSGHNSSAKRRDGKKGNAALSNPLTQCVEAIADCVAATPVVNLVLEVLRMTSCVGWGVTFFTEAPYFFSSCFVLFLVSTFLQQLLVFLGNNGGAGNQAAAGKVRRNRWLLLVIMCGASLYHVLTTRQLTTATCMETAATWGALWAPIIVTLCIALFDATNYTDFIQAGDWVISAPSTPSGSSTAQITPTDDRTAALSSSASASAAGATTTTISLAMATGPSKTLLWAADIYFAYLFWGGQVQLYQVVYYSPMVAMEFTVEAAFSLLPIAARFLLGFKSVWSLMAPRRVGGKDGYAWCYALSTLGLFTFDITRNVGAKTAAACIVPACIAMAQRARILATAVPNHDEYDQTTEDTSRLYYSEVLGLVMSMTVRILYVSLDPIHVSPLINALAIPVTLFFASVMWRQAKYGSGHGSGLPSSPTGASGSSVQMPVISASTAMYGGLAVGALRTLCMSFLANGGMLSRFVGLPPFPHALLVILCFSLGIWVDSAREGVALTTARNLGIALVSSSLCFYYASSGSDRAFQKPNSGKPVWYDTPLHKLSLDDWYTENQWGSPWLAFTGGLAMVFCMGLMIPSFMSRVFAQSRTEVNSVGTGSTARKLELWAFLGEWGLIFAMLCTTSYPFIPGGFFFRDHYQYVVCAGCAIVGLGYVNVLNATPTTRPDARRSVLTPGIFVFLLAMAVVFAGWRSLIDTPDNSKPPTVPAIVVPEDTAKGVVPCIAKNPQGGGVKEEHRVSFMIWTIHFALDNWGSDSSERLYQLVHKTGADVIGILESDMSRPTNGVRDIVEYLAYRLGYEYVDYGPTAMDSTFGSAIISRYPILKLHRHVMPSPVGELAPMIEAVLDVAGSPVVTFVGHFGNTDHKWDLRLQSQFLGQRAAATDLPAVFLGYLTTDVHKNNYHYMVRLEKDQKQLPLAEEHLKDRMEHNRLFKDTAYHMYKHSQWRIITAEQREHILAGRLREAKVVKALNRDAELRLRRDATRRAKNPQDFHNGRDDGDEQTDHTALDDGDIVSKKEHNRMVKEDNSGDRTDAFWNELKSVIWREQDQRNDTYVYYPNSGRIGNAHPRWEYWDRYCQHILYKPGYELAQNAAKCGSSKMHLEDWFRWNYVNDLSDTEIQVARFVFSETDPLPGGHDQEQKSHLFGK